MGRKPLSSAKKIELQKTCRLVRRDVIEMIYSAKSGNPGSALSAVEFLAYLYFHYLNIRVDDPDWVERDRFVLSKGHAAPTLYAAMARYGFFPVGELTTFRKFNSRLQTHPEFGALPGLDFTSGSLAQGLSAGVGMALGLRLQQQPSQVVVYLGDGEIQEGQVWEAAMSAAHYQLGQLIAIVDSNKFQGDASISEVMDLGRLADKWRSFGWSVLEVDGHEFDSIDAGFSSLDIHDGSPKVLIGHTIKGRGVSFMEGNNRWHVGGHMTQKEYEGAVAELSGASDAS